jgi:hypothetical protein
LRVRREVEEAIAFDQPLMQVGQIGPTVRARGEYRLRLKIPGDDALRCLARHNISIDVAGSYPEEEPVVIILDRSLPRGPAHHIDATGVCCVTTFDVWRLTAADTSFNAYLAGPLRNFFLSHVVRKHDGVWPFDEWSHDVLGLIEAIAAEIIGCAPVARTVRTLLRRYADGSKIELNMRCPCRSGRAFDGCCGDAWIGFRRPIPASEARRLLHRIEGRPSDLDPTMTSRFLRRNRPNPRRRR